MNVWRYLVGQPHIQYRYFTYHYNKTVESVLFWFASLKYRLKHTLKFKFSLSYLAISNFIHLWPKIYFFLKVIHDMYSKSLLPEFVRVFGEDAKLTKKLVLCDDNCDTILWNFRNLSFFLSDHSRYILQEENKRLKEFNDRNSLSLKYVHVLQKKNNVVRPNSNINNYRNKFSSFIHIQLTTVECMFNKITLFNIC